MNRHLSKDDALVALCNALRNAAYIKTPMHALDGSSGNECTLPQQLYPAAMRLVALDEICLVAGRSRAWFYAHGLVTSTSIAAMPNRKFPPPPWEPLPPPCIEGGKHLWLLGDITAWLARITTRASSITSTNCVEWLKAEVRHEHA